MTTSSEIKPSKEQQAILAVEKDTIVIANPGTGKTTTVSFKVINLLENNVEPEDILCITYTEKAKKEMFDTIYKMAIEKNIPETKVMKLNIFTFHGFAYNYLTELGIISGEIIGNNFLRYSILESFQNEKALNYGTNYIIDSIVPRVENAIRYIKSFGITVDKIDLKQIEPLLVKYHNPTSNYSLDDVKAFLGYFKKAYEHFENSKNDTNDYSDMLLKFMKNYQGEKFPYVLVDEMQDMNEIEADMVDLVSDNLFLVGDAKQAIFGFQGGSIQNFQRFKKRCTPMLLSTNMRSTQEILDYSKKYFLGKTQLKEQYEDELKNFNSPRNGSVPKIFSTGATNKKILDLIEKYAEPEKTIGIITRKNWQIIEISKHLDFHNINYSTTASQSTTKQARDEIVRFLKGIISDKMEDKVNGALTIFSPYSIKEGFDLSLAFRNKDATTLKKLESWMIPLNNSEIDYLFSKRVYPMCATRGSEWYLTAQLVHSQIIEIFKHKTPTSQELFDFISIGEENYTDRNRKAKVTLTSVHKAKGLSFDTVIYVPKEGHKTSFTDAIVTAILSANGITIKDELVEESLRVDFVAFTRAKDNLFVVADDARAGNFQIKDLSEIEVISDARDEAPTTKVDNHLSEAFSLFSSGRYDDAKKLLEKGETWLVDLIFSYFSSVDRFSYSNIKTDPFDFLKSEILKRPFSTPSTTFGSDVHKALENILLGKAKPEDFPEENMQKAIKNALTIIEELENEFPGLKVIDTETKIALPVKSIFNYSKDDLIFSGKLDVVLKHDDGYLIIDFKTDKDTSYSDSHKRQLALYKKMYSVSESIPEDQIKVCVIYIALRGNIETGRYDGEKHMGGRNVFSTIERYFQKILGWRQDPGTFIDDFTSLSSSANSVKYDETLYFSLKDILEKTKISSQ